MDSLKRVRKKFLTCFRPPLSSVDDGYNQQKRHPTDDGSNHNKIFTYVSLHDQDTNEMVLRKFITSVTDKNNKFKASFGGDDDGGAACKKDKKSSRRAFSRAIKAVFFETSLAKKIRRRKNKKVAPASESNRSSTSTGDSNVTSKKLHPELLISGDSNSSWSSLTYSSSSSSSFSSINPSTLLYSSCASSLPQRSSRFSELNRSCHAGLSYPPMNTGLSYPPMKEEDTRCPARGDGKNCNSNFGLCLILLCLLVLMTWGRVFAIFCTSTCLFMIPSYVYRRRIGVAPGQISRLPCFDSAAHKKRVIMEGWLERRHRVS